MLNNIRMLLYALIDLLENLFLESETAVLHIQYMRKSIHRGIMHTFCFDSSINNLNLYIIYVANGLCTAQEVMRECLHVW